MNFKTIEPKKSPPGKQNQVIKFHINNIPAMHGQTCPRSYSNYFLEGYRIAIVRIESIEHKVD